MNRADIITRLPQQAIDAQALFARRVANHPRAPKTYFITTFGCQMNEHDSEKLAGMFSQMGMRPAPAKEEADVVLFNTCCIRDNAERRALGNIIWLKQLKKQKPDMMVIVCGCMMQQQGMAQTVLQKYPFVDIAFGTGNLYRLGEYMAQALDSGARIIEVEGELSTVAEGLPVLRQTPWQAYINIMYGCNNYCSYCIVPYVRGRERSRTAEDILAEARRLADSGVQEITLLGQNVNSYGAQGAQGQISFAQLLRRLDALGIPRIRFMTSHPKDLGDDLIAAMAECPSVCPHLHLPVQSGSERILSAMNRRYTPQQYLERVAALRRAIPHIGLTTDLIVAFPGETRQDFEDTLSLVRQVHYDSAFTFIFSPRAGTRAAQLPGRIDADEATGRIEQLIALQEGITAEVFRTLVGSSAQVLVQGASRRSPRQYTGKSGRNIAVNFEAPPGLEGRIVPVTIVGQGKTTLRGELQKDWTLP